MGKFLIVFLTIISSIVIISCTTYKEPAAVNFVDQSQIVKTQAILSGSCAGINDGVTQCRAQNGRSMCQACCSGAWQQLTLGSGYIECPYGPTDTTFEWRDGVVSQQLTNNHSTSSTSFDSFNNFLLPSASHSNLPRFNDNVGDSVNDSHNLIFMTHLYIAH